MKKTFILLLLLALSITLSSCALDNDSLDKITALEDNYDKLQEDYDLLEKDNEDLKNSIIFLEEELNKLDDSNVYIMSILNEISEEDLESKLDLIKNIDSDLLSNLDNIVTELNSIKDSITSLEQSIYDLDSATSDTIESINSSIDSLSLMLDTVNETVIILSNSNDDEVIELSEELEALLLEVNVKLNFLRSFDISDYSLDDDIIHEILYKLEDSYNSFLPDEFLNPVNSTANNSCITLTYEICQTYDNSPNLYTKHYEYAKEQIEYVRDKQEYINILGELLSTIPGELIPVFPEETDVYDDLEIYYSSRESNKGTYEMRYNTTLNDEDVIFDVLYEVIKDYSDYHVTLTVDVKSESNLDTIETVQYKYYYDQDLEPEMIQIFTTNHPINKQVNFAKANGSSIIYARVHEEFVKEKYVGFLYNDEFLYLEFGQDSLSPEVIDYSVEEVYDSNGLMIMDYDGVSYDVVPLQRYSNWKKTYYREDGELTKIKISKVILEDNSEIVVSDEQYSDSYTKIVKMDLGYYDNDEFTELEDYLVVAHNSSSILSQNIQFNDEMNTSIANRSVWLNSFDVEADLDEFNYNLDVSPYTYKETPTLGTKTKAEVYQDALDFLEIAQQVCSSSSYCYYSTIDRYTVGYEFENYYSTDSYVYYPNHSSYQRVYLYAKYVGDYQFVGKNPLNYDEDSVTTR